MHLDRYEVTSTNDLRSFEFLSEGPNGTIKKIVLFQHAFQDYFYLAFGDWDEIKQGINDQSRTNNNDRDKVIATVASTVVTFLSTYPDATIFATGSTPSRTRLYQSGIIRYWMEIATQFIVEGFANDQWEPVRKKVNYEAFLIKKRN